MPSGPKIISISAGDALSATTINANFLSIQDFLSAIPVDQLDRYYSPSVVGGIVSSTAVSNGETAYGAYFMPEQSSSDASRLKSIQCSFAASANLVAAETVVVTLEERTSVGTADDPGPYAASTWSAVASATITMDDSIVREDGVGGVVRTYWANDAADAGTELNASRLHRFKVVVTTGTSTATCSDVQCWAYVRTKLQTG